MNYFLANPGTILELLRIIEMDYTHRWNQQLS